MVGVWPWADHIQGILRSTKLFGQLGKTFWCMKFWQMKNQCLQYEGVYCSSHPMRSFRWAFEGSQMFSFNRLNFISFQGWSPKGAWRWQLVPLVLHFKEEVGVRTISSASPSNKGHNLKKNHPIFVSGWMWRFLQREVFQIYPRGREAKIWGNTGALRFVRLQLTAKIFLAPDHTGGVHNASLTHFGLP